MPTITLPDSIVITSRATKRSFTVDLSPCSADMIMRVVYHGLHQRINDAVALGKDASDSDKIEAQDKVVANIHTWMNTAPGTRADAMTPAEEYRLDAVTAYLTHTLKLRGSVIKTELKGLDGTGAMGVLKGKLAAKDFRAVAAQIERMVATRLAFIGLAVTESDQAAE